MKMMRDSVWKGRQIYKRIEDHLNKSVHSSKNNPKIVKMIITIINSKNINLKI